MHLGHKQVCILQHAGMRKYILAALAQSCQGIALQLVNKESMHVGCAHMVQACVHASALGHEMFSDDFQGKVLQLSSHMINSPLIGCMMCGQRHQAMSCCRRASTVTALQPMT